MNASMYIPLLGALSAFLLTVSLVPTKSALTRTLEEYQSKPQGDEWAPRFAERLLQATLNEKSFGGLQQKLVEAGWYTVTPIQIVLRIIGAALAGLALALLFLRFFHLPMWLDTAILVPGFLLCVHLPISAIERAREKRKAETERALPDLLDMVASTVQAGLSVNAALAYAVDTAPGALGDEVKEALSEIRLGRSRAEALTAAARRLNQIEFTTTVTALNQAERLGANIAKVLTELAEDTRNHRIMLAEEHAAKLPVKMVFPMAFFMLPSIYTIIFGTLIANYFATRK